MKVLHLPTSVGGNSWNLAQGEKALGLESEVLVAAPSWANYRADINLDLPAVPSRMGKVAKLVSTFLSLRSRYDVFHFNFGSSLVHFPQFHLNQFELPLYPRRAALFATYNGCDARQKYPTMQRTKIAACHNPNCYAGQCNSGLLDRYRREGIEKMSRYAHHLWALNPDLLYFLPAEKASFLPYAVDGQGIGRSPPQLDAKKLKIVHAPTNRVAKGTDGIISALEHLEKTHPGAVEFRLVENVAHQQALQLYRDADLVIDQTLIGWYGGFAIELMMMGKPVIARIATEDLHFIPQPMAQEVTEAFINVTPDTLYDTLRLCVEDRGFLARHAQAGEAYAHRWHNLEYVAGLTRQKYEEVLA